MFQIKKRRDLTTLRSFFSVFVSETSGLLIAHWHKLVDKRFVFQPDCKIAWIFRKTSSPSICCKTFRSDVSKHPHN